MSSKDSAIYFAHQRNHFYSSCKSVQEIRNQKEECEQLLVARQTDTEFRAGNSDLRRYKCVVPCEQDRLSHTVLLVQTESLPAWFETNGLRDSF